MFPSRNLHIETAQSCQWKFPTLGPGVRARWDLTRKHSIQTFYQRCCQGTLSVGPLLAPIYKLSYPSMSLALCRRHLDLK